MKQILLLIFTTSLSFNFAFGQSFTVTSIINLTSGATINIPVTGVPTGHVLQQVNLKFGDGSPYSGSIYEAIIKLKKPGIAATIDLINTTSLGGSSNPDLKWFDIHLKDLPGYKTPAVQKGGSNLSDGYPFFYGFYSPAQSWSTFNAGTQNGNWEININSLGTALNIRKFNTVQLVFGPPLSAPIDIRSGNQSCATKKCVQTGNTYLATNNGYTNNQNNPSTTVGGCLWNAENNNKSWFYFIASGTTAEISFSGLESRQQSIIVNASNVNNCAPTFTTIPTGACMLTMFGSLATKTIQYDDNAYNAGNGYRFNHGYSLSGLTPGNMYIFVIEGSMNANSDFLIDITSGASGGCSALPISLLTLTATPTNQGVSVNWSTASERNNDYFTISRSSDLENWEEVGKVAGKGNSNTKLDYSFTDIAPLNGISYYQLNQTDFNGDNESFEAVSVEVNANKLNNAVAVFPNPTKAGFDVQVYATNENNALISIHNMSGKTVIKQEIRLEKGMNLMPIKNGKLDLGVYLVKIQFEDGTNMMTKLIVE